MVFSLDLGCTVLRELMLSDAPSLTRHANDRRIWLQLGDMFPHPYREEDAIELRGIATAAVRALTSWSMDQLGLIRLFAIPFAHNVASCRVLGKAGYVREGLLRKSAIKDGHVLDQVLYDYVG